MPALRRPHCGPRRRTLLHTPPYGRHTSARQERSWKGEAKKNCLGNCSRGPKPLNAQVRGNWFVVSRVVVAARTRSQHAHMMRQLGHPVTSWGLPALPAHFPSLPGHFLAFRAHWRSLSFTALLCTALPSRHTRPQGPAGGRRAGGPWWRSAPAREGGRERERAGQRDCPSVAAPEERVLARSRRSGGARGYVSEPARAAPNLAARARARCSFHSWC